MTDQIEQQLSVTNLDPETIRRAKLTVCARATSPGEAQQFLAMLGLLPESVEPARSSRPAYTATNNCRRCKIGIVNNGQPVPPGSRRHKARGLCCNCYRLALNETDGGRR